jgi:hypothetical protein
MADAVKAEGLVLALTNETGGVYPFACAKDANLTITSEPIELAPKVNSAYRQYIKGRKSYTISGSGLVKLVESNMQPLTFFEPFIESTDVTYIGYLDIIDNQNNYKVYQFNCVISSLSIDSNVGNFGQYSYTLQGTGPFTEITSVDTYTVSAGTITARATTSWKLVAVGYGGKWYYNYTVSAGPVINLGSSLNGTTVMAVYVTS